MRQRAYLYHLLFWCSLYLLWVAAFRSYSVSITRTMTVEFCYLIFITIDYYAVSYFVVPRFLLKRKYILFVLTTLFVIAFSAWLRALVSLQMNLHVFHTAIPPDFYTLYLNSIFNIALWVLLITIGKMILDRMQTQQKLEFLEAEKTRHELDFLKAQINPHALFNSLNTIYGHIDKKNQVAKNTLLQFSELLRYQLYDCSAEKVSLEKELAYIKNYISFQQLRKDERLIVEVEIDQTEERLMIAPLLLVVLIENAFKYVSNFTDKENKIVIKIVVKGTVLHSSFINTTEPIPPAILENAGGIGIANLKRRLEILYPDQYKFETNSGNDFYGATLTIELL